MDYDVKLGEVFGPLCLLSHEKLCHSKVLQILVIGDNINWGRGFLKVVLPASECFITCQQLLVVNIVVQLSTGKDLGVESDGMKFAVRVVHGENGHKCIVQSVSFHNQELVGNPVREDRSRSERFL